MAKKPASKDGNDGLARGVKSQAIRDYLEIHRRAMPKEVVLALKEKGITVSPNMVSILKAKSKIKKAHRSAKRAAAEGSLTSGESSNVNALDAAFALYKAALGMKTPPSKVRQAFLTVVESLG